MSSFVIRIYYNPGQETFFLESAIKRYSLNRECNRSHDHDNTDDAGQVQFLSGVTRDPEKIINKVKKLRPKEIRILLRE